MIKKVFLILVLSALYGCTATGKNTTPLLKTLNIGVLENTRLAQWRLMLMAQQGATASVVAMKYEDLLSQMSQGNLDLVVGLPQTDAIKHFLPPERVVIATRQFDYFVAQDDKRQLDEYIFQSNFIKQVSRLGYVGEGEPGIINELVMPKPHSHQTYVKCASLKECEGLLKSHDIDAVYSDVTHFYEAGLSVAYHPVGFSKQIDFTLLMNQKTLTEQERKELKRLFSITYDIEKI